MFVINVDFYLVIDLLLKLEWQEIEVSLCIIHWELDVSIYKIESYFKFEYFINNFIPKDKSSHPDIFCSFLLYIGIKDVDISVVILDIYNAHAHTHT